jgi:hypothetical protein
MQIVAKNRLNIEKAPFDQAGILTRNTRQSSAASSEKQSVCSKGILL